MALHNLENTMTTIINTKIGTAKGGMSRIWIEGQKLFHAGMRIGQKYVLRPANDAKRLELVPSEATNDGHYFTVSKRERNGIVYPLLEIRTDLIAALFKGCEKVRVAIRDGRIIVSALQLDLKIKERVERLKQKLASKEKLAVGSLFHGGGVLDKAMHSGLMAVGVASFVMVAVEMESVYLDASLRNNPELFTDESYAINSDIRDVSLMGSVPQLDLCYGGVPCTGASRSGMSKNGLEFAEEHSEAGALFFDYLEFIKASNPAIAVLENVPEYAKSASMAVIRSVLQSLGYVLYETVLAGSTFGDIEDRHRLVMVAVTKGLENEFPFVFPNTHPQVVNGGERTLGDVLEDIPEDSPMWKSYDYLAEKEARDLANGKGFKRNLVTGSVSTIGTQGKGYAKARSTEVQILHPTNPKLSRLLTPVEHAGVKGVPACVVDGLSATRAHEVLGQSVCFRKFEAVGYAVGSFLLGQEMPAEYLMAEYDFVETSYEAVAVSGITSYCDQVCGGDDCGVGPVCQYGIDPNTHMPPVAPVVESAVLLASPVQLDILAVA